jgi:regulator of replication initiation timing
MSDRYYSDGGRLIEIVENKNKRIKQLEFDCEDFRKAAKIALKDRDKQVIKVKQLEDTLRKIDEEGYKIELSTKYSKKKKNEFICLKCMKKVKIAQKALEKK